jgi:DNA invertase Pin-like site-specific DNA recombinase
MTSQWSCIWNCALGPENQRAAVAAAGVEKEEDRGAVTDRKALAKAIGALGPGDVLLLARLDRLGRSTRDFSTC